MANKTLNRFMTTDRFTEILEKFHALKPVLVVGDIGIDKYTLGEVTRISPEAPVPVLEVGKEWPKLGLASNIVHNFKTLNVKTTLSGVVGFDANADLLERLLEENGLSIWGIVRDNSRPTTFKERITTNIQQICRVDYEKTHPLSIEIENKIFASIKEFIPTHGSVILEDYAKGTLTDSLIAKVIETAKKHNSLIAVDPYRTKKPEIYKGATLFKPNLTEGKILAKTLGVASDKWEAMTAVFLQELDLQMVAMTLGPDGMIVHEKGKSAVHVPTVPTEVFDVSGAGDTTISILVAALSAGATLVEAAVFGNCAAGVVVGKKGTATVDQKELYDFFQNKYLS